MSSRSPLRRLRHLDKSSSNYHDRVSNVLYGEEYKQWVPTIQGDDLVGLVDYLDTALDNIDPASPAFRKCLRELRHVCSNRTILPPSYTLSSRDLVIGRQPVASGGSGDVYEGSLNGLKVCVKRIRVYSKDGPGKATKALYQGAVVWKRLEHRNIVPLLGITPTPLQLISEWMPGGDLTEYIKKCPGADRLSLLSDITGGLHFLHLRNIVHGDLKGPNILVDDAGLARITDFGLATVTQNLDSMRTASEDQGHTARWTAPEILTEEGTYSKEADIFSFAMVMIEVFTGAVPFSKNLPAAATLAIMAGERPPRPTHSQFTNQLWTLMQRCWNQDPLLRPEASEVFKVLTGFDPTPTKPTIYRISPASTLASASTLTVGQYRRNTGHNLKIARQRSNHSSTPLLPRNGSGDAGTGEDEGVGDHHPSEVQGGESGGRISRRSSHRSTGASDTSPTPIDPPQFDLDELRTAHSRSRRAGRSSTNPRSTLGGNASRRNVCDMGFRVDLDQDSDDDEGKYWLKTRRDKGGSRSALNVGSTDQLRYHPGGQNRDPSNMHLPHNLSKNTLAQRNRYMSAGRTGSRLDLVNPSKRDISGMGGHATGNASQYKSLSRAKSRQQSRLDLDKTSDDDQDFPPPETQAYQGLREPLAGKRDRAGLSDPQTSDRPGDAVPKKNPKIHGLWCRLKRCCSKYIRIPSFVRLPKIHSPGRPVRYKKTKTHTHGRGTNGSRVNFSRGLANRSSGVVNGDSTRNPSHHGPQAGTRYDHRSRVNLTTTLPGVSQYLPQVPGHQQGPLPVSGNHIISLSSRITGVHANNREIGRQSTVRVVSDPSNPPAWKRLAGRTLLMRERIHLVTDIFSDRNEVKKVGNLRGDDAQAFVDAIDEVLDSLSPQIRRRCLRSLYKICGRQTILPRSLEIPPCYDPKDDPLCYGGFADVWKGEYRGREVAAKVLRVYKTSNLDRIKRRFCREVVAWKTLRHPNVLPLLGVTVTENRFVMVSEWMMNGNIKEFTKSNISADYLGLLVEITRGLIYMHGQGVIHGDLKGANILINQSGHACLADFSLLTIVAEQSTIISSCVEGGTIQWMSPELIYPEVFGLKKSIPTKESDCYALGMVIYEVLSGRTPYSPCRPPAVMRKVLDGERPGRPQGREGSLFTDSIWEVVELCWKPQPCDRISARAVLRGLEGSPSPLGAGGDAGMDADDQWDVSSNDSSDDELPVRPQSVPQSR